MCNIPQLRCTGPDYNTPVDRRTADNTWKSEYSHGLVVPSRASTNNYLYIKQAHGYCLDRQIIYSFCKMPDVGETMPLPEHERLYYYKRYLIQFHSQKKHSEDANAHI